MIARVASHCFWFGRYLERTESCARALNVTRDLALDGLLRPRQCWQPLLIVSGEEASFCRRFGADLAGDGDAVQEYMSWDEQNANSLYGTIRSARDNARSIRDVLPLEVWEICNELYLWSSSESARGGFASGRHDFYRHIRHHTQLMLGLMRGSMLHDQPLDFIWLGVMLERLGQTARTLDMHHHIHQSLNPAQAHRELDTALWLSLMRACSAYEPFLRKFQGRVTAEAAASFLVLERGFPRSLRYCAHVCHDRLCDIRPPGHPDLPGRQSVERMQALDEWLEHLNPGQLDLRGIHALLTRVVDEAAAVGQLVRQEFLGA